MADQVTFERSPSAVALPVLAALAIISATPPLVWHYKNRNTAACSLIFWIILVNIFNLVNAIIWPTDDTAHWYDGKVLCDVEVKLMGASNLGVVGALACIMRNLANVMDTDRTGLIPTRSQRRRQLVINLLLCYGGPIYMILIHYIVQPNRYYIFAISGCTPSYDNSWPSIVLVFIWPPILCLLDTYYCGLVIFRLHRYRQQFSSLVSSSSLNLTHSRFTRLFLIALTLIIIFFPVQFYIFYVNLSFPRLPYSWSLVHGPEWWNIILIPTGGIVAFDRWVRLASGFLIFIFFGLGKDATNMYRKWLCLVGLHHVFPQLARCESSATGSTSQGTSSSTGEKSWGSKIGSRAKLVFGHHRRHHGGKHHRSAMESAASSQNSGNESIVATELLTPSPSDPKKRFLYEADGSSNRSSSTTSDRTAEVVVPASKPSFGNDGAIEMMGDDKCNVDEKASWKEEEGQHLGLQKQQKSSSEAEAILVASSSHDSHSPRNNLP